MMRYVGRLLRVALAIAGFDGLLLYQSYLPYIVMALHHGEGFLYGMLCSGSRIFLENSA